jgi:predicted nucleotidyltransferase
MDKRKQKWTVLQQELFSFLCIHSGQSFSLRELAKSTKRSPTAVSNSVKLFEKGILNIEKSKSMNLVEVELNRENQKAVELKRIENLKQTYDSGLKDSLVSQFPGSSIVLFGSYSLGEDILNKNYCSDIDIAVIGSKKKEINLEGIEKELKRKILINFYENWEKINKDLRNNILNGIFLMGGANS